MEELTKVCSKCKEEKPLAEFYKEKRGKFGVMGRCKYCKVEYQVEYYAKPEVKARQTEYQAEYDAKPENRAKKAENQAEWCAKPENRVRKAEWCAEYYAKPENKAKQAEYQARWRAEKLNACPLEWYQSDKEKIDALYLEAVIKTIETGILHVIDHIIPFKNKKVAGLHVYCNLQILTEEENLKKHNKLLDEH